MAKRRPMSDLWPETRILCLLCGWQGPLTDLHLAPHPACPRCGEPAEGNVARAETLREGKRAYAENG